MAVKWLAEPEGHDYDAAAAYLSMLAENDAVDKTVTALRQTKPVFQKAKDILRAAELKLLPENNAHVRADLAKISYGYHRFCTSYITDENTGIPCHLVSWR
jgi:hypothetical protein